MNRSAGLLVVLMVWGSLSGCAMMLLGAGAAGGYAISKDSVTSHHDLPIAQVFRQGQAILQQKGVVTLEDAKSGMLQGEVHGATVTITVKQLTPKTVTLKVKARKNLLPAVDVAQDVHTALVKQF